MRYYTGVGARKTPKFIQEMMTSVALILSQQAWVLRSGGAEGADTAFEKGATHKDIYLPWPKFNKNPSPLYAIGVDAFQMASQLHPSWEHLSPAVRKLHARNVYQVLGSDLKTPSEYLVCWTHDGAYTEEMCSKSTGGTGMAIRIAARNGVEILNLRNLEHYQNILTFIEDAVSDVEKQVD